MPIPDATKREIIRLYSTDISIAAVSKLTMVSEPTVTKILKAAGVEIRRKNYQKLVIDKDEINRRYNNGESTYQIATSLGCSDETIRLLITKIRDISIRNKLQPESIAKISAASSHNWTDPGYVEKFTQSTSTPEYLNKLREAGRRNYHNTLGKWIASTEAKLSISKRVKEQWADPAYRSKQEIWFRQRIETITNASKLALTDPDKRKDWLAKLRLANADRRQSNGWISTAQKQFYYILSSSGIDYYEEGPDTRVGPFYVVDCIIPKQQKMLRPLIVEVQGEYWHSLPSVIIRDRQKETYVRKYTDYDLLQLPELNLASFNDIEYKLSEYGLNLKKIECKPAQLDIKKIDESVASMFYSIYHYTGTIRKGAIVYGAYFGDELVAAISYCYPLRVETSTRLGYRVGEVVEISRLARRTNLVCRNLISYFISKTKALLSKEIKCIVSFSDATYGHSGGTYKAAGFVEDGIVPPDYHYISINGKYHKKTIWDRAKRMKMSESEYANKHNLAKVYHGEKTRWVFHR